MEQQSNPKHPTLEEEDRDDRTSETAATYVPRFILTLTISRPQPSTLDADTTMDEPPDAPAVPSSSTTAIAIPSPQSPATVRSDGMPGSSRGPPSRERRKQESARQMANDKKVAMNLMASDLR
jgi:hypothetical protein